MNTESRKLVDGGVAAIRELISQRRYETLTLEFKAFESTEKEPLSRTARGRLVKAVGGMANAGGGTIILGVQTVGTTGLDQADREVLAHDADRLRDLVEATIAENIDPQHSSILVYSIRISSHDSRGFVVIDVPPSDVRPHMSTAKDQYTYFRRGLVGTIPMSHTEIRDMMFSPRSAVLDVSYNYTFTMRSGHDFDFDINIFARNSGSVAAVAPLLIVSDPYVSLSYQYSGDFTRNARSDGSVGFAGSRNFILHSDNEIKLASIRATIWLKELNRRPSDYIRLLLKERLEEDFGFFKHTNSPRPTNAPKCLPQFTVSLSAENARSTRSEFRYDEWALLESLEPAIRIYDQ